MGWTGLMRALGCAALMALVPAAGFCQQDTAMFGTEPPPEILGAPLYPGAEFIRTLESLDPTYETAMYVSLVPFDMVESFMERKMPEKRLIYYDATEFLLDIFLLRTWSDFPMSPTREELDLLSREPSLQIREYNPREYDALADYFARNPETFEKSTLLRNGQTLLLYTYEKKVQPTGNEKYVGTWEEASRGVAAYYGMTIQFREDGTYALLLTPENIAALAAMPRFSALYGGSAVADSIAARNPEEGTFQVLDNTISMVSEAPYDGVRVKSGLVRTGGVTLSLELINMPRLSFLKK